MQMSITKSRAQKDININFLDAVKQVESDTYREEFQFLDYPIELVLVLYFVYLFQEKWQYSQFQKIRQSLVCLVPFLFSLPPLAHLYLLKKNLHALFVLFLFAYHRKSTAKVNDEFDLLWGCHYC